MTVPLMPDARKLPYWRLSGFYFFYFAALGCFLPYWALYLQSLGFSHAQIGQVMAILPATKVISPNLWGWLADRSGRNVAVIRLTSCLTAASFGLVFWGTDFLWLALASLCMGFFWNAPIPLFEALTLSYLRQDFHRYSHIRIWGSIGFVSFVFLAGWALNTVVAIECLPEVIFALFAGMAAVAMILPGGTNPAQGKSAGRLTAILGKGEVIAFFIAFLLIQIAHGPYYTFFSVYLKEHGYDAQQTGVLWSLAVVAEILLFAFCYRLFKRFSMRTILLAAIALSVARWLIIAWRVDDLALLAGSQLLHAASFSATHVAAVQFIHKHFPWPHQGMGQALYSSLSFGLGGTLGSYASGEAWAPLGPHLIFSVAAGLTLAAFFIVLGWVERPSPRGP